MQAKAAERQQGDLRMQAREDLTNVQFSILNSHPKGEAAACVRSYLALVEHFAIRHPLRMRIEHWELSIGQIPGRIQGSGFCQVIFARALNSPRQRMLTTAPTGKSHV